MSGAYEEGYFDPRRDDEVRQAARVQEYNRLFTRTNLDRGTVVDIGCGLGEFLDLFPGDRWDKYAIEVSQLAMREAREKGICFDLPTGEGWCDLVVLRGSLQHLDRPIETLARAFEWLRPGGWIVFLATPNAGSLVYRLWQDLPVLEPPLNFVVFSEKLLRQCLVNLGFRDVSFVFPYLRTPYARPVRDHLFFLLRAFGIKRDFPFWKNMLECYARK